jgi:hypothetical protein
MSVSSPVNDRASAVGDIDPSAVGDIHRRSRPVTAVIVVVVGGAVKVSTPVRRIDLIHAML